jgi:4-hydroxybenzoate polyprenyltransferase
MYAMVDREDDLRIGVRSTAILFGRADRLAVAVAQAGTLLALLQVGRIEQLGGWYQGALLVAASMSIWQQILIRDRQPERCFRAFLNNNALGMTVFIGVLLDYTFRSA